MVRKIISSLTSSFPIKHASSKRPPFVATDRKLKKYSSKVIQRYGKLFSKLSHE
ncbi:MAG: hypothetical protein WCO78_00485 [Candidatus Roizmanbacteria bacterium]